MRKIQPAIAGFEYGLGPRAKECRQPLEAGKGKKMDFPLESPERNGLAKTLICVASSHKVCAICYKSNRKLIQYPRELNLLNTLEKAEPPELRRQVSYPLKCFI